MHSSEYLQHRIAVNHIVAPLCVLDTWSQFGYAVLISRINDFLVTGFGESMKNKRIYPSF